VVLKDWIQYLDIFRSLHLAK